MSAQKIHASTQKFTEIAEIAQDIVVFSNGAASLVIEVTASNFALLSKREQDSKIFSYAALLNSLTFPIQILVRNKRINVSSYLQTLDEAEQQTQNELLAKHIRLYREFVHEIVKINVVLNKTFYIIISYSSLEAGVGGVKQTLGKGKNTAYVESARKELLTKAESVHGQLARLAVASKTLEKEELIKLFYNIYNEDDFQAAQIGPDTDSVIVKAVS